MPTYSDAPIGASGAPPFDISIIGSGFTRVARRAGRNDIDYRRSIYRWSIIGNIVAGRISDRFGRRNVGPLFIAMEAVLAYELYSIGTGAIVMLWIGWLFCDQAGMTVTSAYSAELFPTAFRSAATSTLYVARYAGGAVGLVVKGILYNVSGSPWSAIRALTSLWLMTAVLMYLLFPETARRELEEIAPTPSPTRIRG